MGSEDLFLCFETDLDFCFCTCLVSIPTFGFAIAAPPSLSDSPAKSVVVVVGRCVKVGLGVMVNARVVDA